MEHCPFTEKLAGIAERGEKEAADVLYDHIQTCASCRAEVLRLNARPDQKHGGLKGVGKNFLLGLGVVAAVGVFMGFRAMTDVIRDATGLKR